MAFEGLFENFKTSSISLKDKVMESPTAQNIQDRYQNLNPSQQKLVLFLLNTIAVCTILYFPIDHYLSSNEFTQSYEEKRSLTKDLIRSHRTVNHLPDIPIAQDANTSKSIIENQLKEMNLLPEQIKYVNITSGSSKIIPLNKIQYGVEIGLNKINIKQITNIGSKLQSIHPSLKLKDMLVTSNREDGRYQDVVFKLIALNIPKYAPPIPEPEPKKNSKSRRNGG
ncbi:MAG: hypothetical protein KDD45_17295 [Bdellovibrionales bacterium]|nr:hypothetical protein [Bdellovibrionales bacterium]